MFLTLSKDNSSNDVAREDVYDFQVQANVSPDVLASSLAGNFSRTASKRLLTGLKIPDFPLSLFKTTYVVLRLKFKG